MSNKDPAGRGKAMSAKTISAIINLLTLWFFGIGMLASWSFLCIYLPVWVLRSFMPWWGTVFLVVLWLLVSRLILKLLLVYSKRV